MTKAQYAEHRKISRPMVSKLIREDRILVTESGHIDQEISDLLMDSFSESPLRNDRDQLKTQLQSVGDYATQRALLTQYKAEMAKLELDRARGDLVDSAYTQQCAFSTARRVRDAVLRIPDRIAPMVAAESDQTKVRTLLDQELRQALEELSDEITSTDI